MGTAKFEMAKSVSSCGSHEAAFGSVAFCFSGCVQRYKIQIGTTQKNGSSGGAVTGAVFFIGYNVGERCTR